MVVAFLTLIVFLGVLLPVAAWLLTSRMVTGRPPYARMRRDAHGFPMDPVEAWLTDHTNLDPLQRQNVRRSVLSGRPAAQESLRPAARDLATAMLAGAVRPRSMGRGYWTMLAAGGLLLGVAVALMLAVRPVPSYAVIWAIDGSILLLAGLFWPRLLRRRLQRAAHRDNVDDHPLGPSADGQSGRPRWSNDV